MVDYFIIKVSEEEIRREKEKARELRGSRWWKNRVAKGICQYCGGEFPPDELTMDHIVPIIRKGKSVRGNVAPACKECNSRKRHMLPMEWEEYMESIVKGGGRKSPQPQSEPDRTEER